MKSLGVGAVVVIITLFMYVNAPALFGEFAPQAERIMQVYLFLLIGFLAMFNIAMPGLDTTPRALTGFVVMFFATWLIVGAVPRLITSSFEPLTLVSLGFLYAFVKAYIEEVVFRQILPKTLALGDIVSNILFGLFHFAVLFSVGVPLMTVLFSMVFLMVLGYIWSMVRDHFGILGATGSHFAWNMVALGVI